MLLLLTQVKGDSVVLKSDASQLLTFDQVRRIAIFFVRFRDKQHFDI
jgi:hypothetical protein